MGMNMHVSTRYASHLPVLMRAYEVTSGDVLELGPGVFSTPYLHWVCERDGRNLLSIENSWDWHFFTRKYYRTDLHKHLHFKNWDDADNAIRKEWGLVFVDHSPAERRVVETAKLADLAQIIVIHDSDIWRDKNYHYSTIYPLFKYRFDFTKTEPATTALSNFVDLKDFL